MELEHLFPLNTGTEFITFEVEQRNSTWPGDQPFSSILLKGFNMIMEYKYFYKILFQQAFSAR